VQDASNRPEHQADFRVSRSGAAGILRRAGLRTEGDYGSSLLPPADLPGSPEAELARAKVEAVASTFKTEQGLKLVLQSGEALSAFLKTPLRRLRLCYLDCAWALM
jgi:hypothetical protein